MQDGLDLIDALAAHPETGAAPGDASSTRSSSARRRRRRPRRSSTSIAGVYLHERLRHASRDAATCCCRRSSGTARPTSRATRWPVGVRRPRAQGSRLDRASRSNDALTPLVNMGQQLFEPPDVSGWDLGPGVVLDRRDAGADELRVAARGQPEVQPARRGARRRRRRRRRCSSYFARSRCTPRRFDADVASELLDYLRAGGAWTGMRRAAADEGRRASCTSSPAPASISSSEAMTITRRREFVKGGVAAFTVGFAAPEFLSRSRAGAGRAAPQPRRALPERRQRRAQHAGAVQRSVLLQPAADDRRPGRQVLQIGTDSGGRRARPAPAAHRPEADLRPRPPRAHPAHRLRELEPLALPRAPTSGRPPIRRNSQGTGWLGRYLDSLPSPVDPLVGWNTTGETPPHAARRARVGVPAIPEPGGYAFASPNARRRSDVRERSARRASRRTCRSIGRTWRSSTAARRRRSPRSIASRTVGHLSADAVTYPNNGFAQALQAVAGAMTKRHRHAGVLGADRRLRHARRRRTSTGQRRLLQPDGDAERRRCSAFYNDLKPGPARRHAGAAVLGVRPAHQRERQPAAPITARPA